MDKKTIIREARMILQNKGPMSCIVLSYRLREDCGLSVSSNQLAQIIKRFGGNKIHSHIRTNETGFGSYKVAAKALIYEAR
jgi:hypothetical protein